MTQLSTSNLSPPPATSTDPELSIVMPCLNEADTLATCIEKAQRALRDHNMAGEILIADNGSTDGSPDIAARTRRPRRPRRG